jgi:outer membrane protein assembly factor BamB
MRRMLLAILLAAGCAKAQTAVNDERPDLWARKAGVDWPCFLGPTHDGVSPEKGIVTQWPKEGLRVLWEAEMGMGFAAPVVSKGRLFHFDRFGNNARLTCRNAETRKRLWTFEYPTDYRDLYGYSPGPRACPIVDEDRVYLHGVEGMLYCIDAISGKEIWKVDTKKEFHFHQNFFGVGSVPLVEGDLLIVPVGGSPPGPRPTDLRQAKGNGTGIVAFDKKTGEVRYKTSDELASFSSPVSATMDGKRWCFYFARGGLLGFEPTSGKVLLHYPWRASIEESAIASNPLILGDRVLISECYQKGSALLRVKPGQAEEIWTDAGKEKEDKSLMCHWNTPIHVDGYVYGSSGRHENEAELRCVELATGKVAWRQPGLERSQLTLIDGHFLCLTERGVLLLLKVNPKKYEPVAQWEVGLDYPSWAAPVVSHGLLYLRGKDRLVCAELIPEK